MFVETPVKMSLNQSLQPEDLEKLCEKLEEVYKTKENIIFELNELIRMMIYIDSSVYSDHNKQDMAFLIETIKSAID